MTSSEIKHVPKGWGYEKWIVNGELYCGKLLFFEKGKRCSWHYHKIKDETFYIQSGELLLIYGEDSDIEKAKMVVLKPGDKFYIQPGLKHQMQAREDTELFEFSTQHFEEDSYRIERGD
jgi:quercetin dioxygenase-like cupin family protein